MKVPKFYVGDGSGGYAETFVWSEAENLAEEESKTEGLRIISQEDTDNIVALYYEGIRYIPATGAICENCLCQLSTDEAHYAYDLTGHFFCSAKCGVALGVLMLPPNK